MPGDRQQQRGQKEAHQSQRQQDPRASRSTLPLRGKDTGDRRGDDHEALEEPARRKRPARRETQRSCRTERRPPSTAPPSGLARSLPPGPAGRCASSGLATAGRRYTPRFVRYEATKQGDRPNSVRRADRGVADEHCLLRKLLAEGKCKVQHRCHDAAQNREQIAVT